MPTFRYPKTARVRKRAEYDRVFQARTSRSDGCLTVHAMRNPAGETRLGIVIPKGTRPALRRNRMKRLIREAFRLHASELPEGFDFVVLPRNHAASLAAIATSLMALAVSVSKLPPRSPAAPPSPRPRSGGTRP